MLNEMNCKISEAKSRFLSGRKLIFWGVGLLLSYQCFAQTQTVEIKENQTSHLIFPSDILYTDIGDNENFIADYTNNIVRVKGIKTDKQTNLTVLTKDQHYYSCLLYTSPSPRDATLSRMPYSA